MSSTDPEAVGKADALPTPLEHLIERARAGGPEAVQELIARFEPAFVRVIRLRQYPELSAIYDVQDFVQEVWLAFFALPIDKYRFRQPQRLHGYLRKLTLNLLGLAVRRQLHCQKRNRQRQLPLGDDSIAAEQLADRQPQADAVALAQEEWQMLLDTQPAGYRQQVLVQLRAGGTHQEIGRSLGISEKTIRRLLGQLLAK